MTAEEQRLLALLECPRIGPAAREKVLRYYHGPPPAEFWGHSTNWYTETLAPGAEPASALAAWNPVRSPLLPRLAELPVRVRCFFQEDYPRRLLRLPKPPPIITTYGSDNVECRLTVALVSSRDASREVLDRVKRAAETVCAAGAVIVAGHNRPVYQMALLAAKRMNTPACMVLDRGLLSAFDEDLRRDPIPAGRIWGYGFDADRNQALSPFRLRDGWVGANNRYRDTMVVALADVLIAHGIRSDGIMHDLCLDAARRGQTVLTDEDGMDLFTGCQVGLWEGKLPTDTSA